LPWSQPRGGCPHRRRVQVRNAFWSAWLRRALPAVARRTVRLAWPARRQPGSRGGVAEAVLGLPWVMRERRPVPPELEAALRAVIG
jgi:hypothetical protein